MKTLAIFKGGPYNEIEEELEGQPLEHTIRETFQNDEKGQRYAIHQYDRSAGEFKESELVPYNYAGIIEQVG